MSAGYIGGGNHKNSTAVNNAMRAAFDELLALTPEELRKRISAVKIGPIGELIKDTETKR